MYDLVRRIVCACSPVASDSFIAPLFVKHTSAATEVSVMVACGPFTLSQSNEATLLLTLLRALKQTRPDVLVLIGPLVDSSQPGAQVGLRAALVE